MGVLDILRLALRPWVWYEAFRLWRRIMFLEEQSQHYSDLLPLAKFRGNYRLVDSLRRLIDDNWDELVTTKAHLQMCIKPTK